MPGEIKGIATPAVAASLGHSMMSYLKGTTAQYVGSMSTDTWTSRVEADFQDPFGLQISETAPPPPKRRRTGAEVTKLCEEQGLVAPDKNVRARASYADQGKQKKGWVKAASNESHEPASETSPISSESHLDVLGTQDSHPNQSQCLT